LRLTIYLPHIECCVVSDFYLVSTARVVNYTQERTRRILSVTMAAPESANIKDLKGKWTMVYASSRSHPLAPH
jgi:hypothetical protein